VLLIQPQNPRRKQAMPVTCPKPAVVWHAHILPVPDPTAFIRAVTTDIVDNQPRTGSTHAPLVSTPPSCRNNDSGDTLR
jgi:hypothetical protein